jgi:predicted amidohydrolase
MHPGKLGTVKFTAAAVQVAPTKANYAANLAKVGEAVAEAMAADADLIVFPETALTGYFLEGGVGEVAVTAEQVANDVAKAVGNRPRPVDVVVGYYESSNGNLYNSASHVSVENGKGSLLHTHRKFFLPTYGVFDEERFVSRGRDISTYETRFGRMATLICEDVWHSIVPTIAVLKGALVINAVAASPARGFSGDTIGNVETYHRIVSAYCHEHGVWSVNAMLVGFEGGKGFTGGSVIANPMGEIVAEGPVGEEYVLTSEVDLDLVGTARESSPFISDLLSAFEDVAREIEDINRTGNEGNPR